MARDSRALYPLVSITLALLLSFIALNTALAQDSDVTMIVTYTEGEGARLRESPSTTAAVVTVIPEGTRVQVSGDVIRADGRTWRKVRDADGHAGYVVVDFLASLDEIYVAPTSTPVPQPQVAQQPQVMQTPQATASPEPCLSVTAYFPAWNDPEGAIQQTVSLIVRDRGINPYLANPFVKKEMEAYALPPYDAVAGWIAHTMYYAVKNDTAQMMTLVEYVEWQHQKRLSLGSLVRSDYLAAVITREQWNEMLAWPTELCAGAILRSPENAKLVRLMSKSVGDSSWLQRIRQG